MNQGLRSSSLKQEAEPAAWLLGPLTPLLLLDSALVSGGLSGILPEVRSAHRLLGEAEKVDSR